MILYLLLGLVAVLMLVALSVRKDAKTLAMRLDDLFRDLDQTYRGFMDLRLSNYVLPLPSGGHLFQKETFELDLRKLLEPHVQALLRLMQESYLDEIHWQYDSEFFPNLAEHCREFLRLDRQKNTPEAYAEQEQLLRQDLEDSVRVDLRARLLAYKIEDL